MLQLHALRSPGNLIGVIFNCIEHQRSWFSIVIGAATLVLADGPLRTHSKPKKKKT